MNPETIKSFLVGLGFGVDEASLAAFNKSIASATLKVSALYASVQATATGIAFGITKISESFEDLGYEYKIIAPAINKALILRQEMLKAYRATGTNLVQVVQNALRLNISITKTKYAFEALYKSVASRFFTLLTKQSDIFRQKLYDHMPKIQEYLERFVQGIFRAFEATITLGSRAWGILGRIYDFFVMLDKATDGWSTKILAALAAWKILNLGFLATPLGMLAALSAALLVLWDDFMTFKEGGESLIDWGSEATQTYVGMAAAILGISTAVIAVATAYKIWAGATNIATAAQWLLNIAMSANPIGLIIAGVTALIGLLTWLDQKWNLFGGHVSGFFTGIGGRILDFLGGPNIQANLQNTPGGVPGTSPVGSNVQNSSHTNINLQSQTNVNLPGVADAQGAASAVSGATGRTTQDLLRYTKSMTVPGATQKASGQ